MFIVNWIKSWRYQRMMKKMAHEDYEYMELYKNSFSITKEAKAVTPVADTQGNYSARMPELQAV